MTPLQQIQQTHPHAALGGTVSYQSPHLPDFNWTGTIQGATHKPAGPVLIVRRWGEHTHVAPDAVTYWSAP